jgi:pyruvate kinase
MTTQRQKERDTSRTLRLVRAARGVDALRRVALAAEQEFAVELDAAAPAMRASAYNLVHYLAVRRLDVRELQGELSRLGLSSLGRMEAHVMASLQAVQEALCTLRQQPVPAEIAASPPITFGSGDALLAANADAILGPARRGRRTRIMVTMPTEADAPMRVAPAATIFSASSRVRMPPEALTPSSLPTRRRIRATSSTVAPKRDS